MLLCCRVEQHTRATRWLYVRMPAPSLLLLVLPAATAHAVRPTYPTLDEVLQRNNHFRAQVASGECAVKEHGDCWINRTILSQSVFNYGIPLNTNLTSFNAVNLLPSLHDLVSWLGAHTVARTGLGLSYLEIGVSSLKNFDTQVNYFRRDNTSVLAAMDIEDPNPKRASTWGEPVVVRAIPSRRFIDIKHRSRAPFRQMLKNSHHQDHPCVRNLSTCVDRTLLWPPSSTVSRHGHHARRNSVVYTAMDQMDSFAWEALAETRFKTLKLPPFDLVFSDGLHTYPAVKLEHRELVRLGLLRNPVHGREFTMVWDDCFVTPPEKRTSSTHRRVGDAVVDHVAPALAEYLRRGLAAEHSVTFCFVHFKMATWVGGGSQGLNEVCLFTTLDISSLLAMQKDESYGGLGGEKCTRL